MAKQVRLKVRDYVDSVLRWDEQGATFDLHLPFGKIRLDRDNRPVDRTYLNSESVR